MLLSAKRNLLKEMIDPKEANKATDLEDLIAENKHKIQQEEETPNKMMTPNQFKATDPDKANNKINKKEASNNNKNINKKVLDLSWEMNTLTPLPELLSQFITLMETKKMNGLLWSNLIPNCIRKNKSQKELDKKSSKRK